MTLEQCYTKALKGLEDDTYKSLATAAQANDLSKSSLGHRKKGLVATTGSPPRAADILPRAEKAVVRWVLKLGDYCFSPRVDILIGLVKHLAKNESAAGAGAGFCRGAETPSTRTGSHNF